MQNNNLNKGIILGLVVLVLFAGIMPTINAQLREGSKEYNNPTNEKTMETSAKHATVTLKSYDFHKNRFDKKTLTKLSGEDAKKLKEELLKTEEMFSSNTDKIRKQFEILHNWDILPKEITFDAFISLFERLNNIYASNNYKSYSNIFPFVIPGIITTGPSIWSLFTIGGISYPLHLFMPEFLQPILMERLPGLPKNMEDVLYNTTLDGWIGVMPVYVPFCSASTFGTIIGSVISGPNIFFSPFFAIQVASFGISIDVTIMNDIYPVTVFDWVISAGLLGSIIYLRSQS